MKTSEVHVHSKVSKISILCQGVSCLIQDEKPRESKRNEVIHAVQVCIGHSEGKHISSDSKYSFIYSRTSFEGLYIAANLCFMSKLDHPLVTEVIRRILKAHGTLEVFFFNMFIFKRHMFWWESFQANDKSTHDCNCDPIKSPICYVNHRDSLDLTEYFLRHASKARLMLEARPPTKLWFENGGPMRRVVDLPMEIGLPVQLPAIGTAIRLGNHEVLLILLRHGAQLIFADPSDDYFNVADYVLTCLFRSFLKAQDKFLKRIPRFDYLSLRYVMRTVPSINAEVWAVSERTSGSDTEDIKTFTDFITTELIPPSRSGSQPPELKHLTRLAIRRVLHSNWSLPSGIYSLGLPQSLAGYIDLLQD